MPNNRIYAMVILLSDSPIKLYHYTSKEMPGFIHRVTGRGQPFTKPCKSHPVKGYLNGQKRGRKNSPPVTL